MACVGATAGKQAITQASRLGQPWGVRAGGVQGLEFTIHAWSHTGLCRKTDVWAPSGLNTCLPSLKSGVAEAVGRASARWKCGALIKKLWGLLKMVIAEHGPLSMRSPADAEATWSWRQPRLWGRTNPDLALSQGGGLSTLGHLFSSTDQDPAKFSNTLLGFQTLLSLKKIKWITNLMCKIV